MTGDLEITEEAELMKELSRDTKKNKPKVETISVSGAKDAEEEKIQICEMSTVSLISAGPQTTKDKETSDGVHLPMSEMPSEIRVQGVERTIRFPAELPSTLNVERRGAGASQITAEAADEAKNRKQPMFS